MDIISWYVQKKLRMYFVHIFIR